MSGCFRQSWDISLVRTNRPPQKTEGIPVVRGRPLSHFLEFNFCGGRRFPVHKQKAASLFIGAPNKNAALSASYAPKAFARGPPRPAKACGPILMMPMILARLKSANQILCFLF
jgi:hypothetical protein